MWINFWCNFRGGGGRRGKIWITDIYSPALFNMKQTERRGEKFMAWGTIHKWCPEFVWDISPLPCLYLTQPISTVNPQTWCFLSPSCLPQCGRHLWMLPNGKKEGQHFCKGENYLEHFNPNEPNIREKGCETALYLMRISSMNFPPQWLSRRGDVSFFSFAPIACLFTQRARDGHTLRWCGLIGWESLSVLLRQSILPCLQGSAKRQGLGCVNSLPGSAWL